MYAVTFIGYWAYGSSTSSYLLNSVNGPVWVKAMANISAFLQTVIALHVTFFYSLTSFKSLFRISLTLNNLFIDICKSNV